MKTDALERPSHLNPAENPWSHLKRAVHRRDLLQLDSFGAFLQEGVRILMQPIYASFLLKLSICFVFVFAHQQNHIKGGKESRLNVSPWFFSAVLTRMCRPFYIHSG